MALGAILTGGIGRACAFGLLLLGGLMLPSGEARAAISGCSMTSTGIVFSPYNSQTKTPVDGAATISVTCTGNGNGNNNQVSINLTGGNGASCGERQMSGGTAALSYQLYRDATRLLPLCNDTSSLNHRFNFTSSGTQTETFTVYGRVAGLQNPAPGTYNDLLTLTVTQGGSTFASTSFQVSGSASASCSVSAGTLGFGTYSAASPSLASAPVSVNCSTGAVYQVSLGSGQNGSGASRRMAGPGGALLAYDLFRDATRLLPWGDGTTLGARLPGIGTGSAQNLTVYGRIPAAQSAAAAGDYGDSVIVTVEY